MGDAVDVAIGLPYLVHVKIFSTLQYYRVVSDCKSYFVEKIPAVVRQPTVR